MAFSSAAKLGLLRTSIPSLDSGIDVSEEEVAEKMKEYEAQIIEAKELRKDEKGARLQNIMTQYTSRYDGLLNSSLSSEDSLDDSLFSSLSSSRRSDSYEDEGNLPPLPPASDDGLVPPIDLESFQNLRLHQTQDNTHS